MISIWLTNCSAVAWFEVVISKGYYKWCDVFSPLRRKKAKNKSFMKRNDTEEQQSDGISAPDL